MSNNEIPEILSKMSLDELNRYMFEVEKDYYECMPVDILTFVNDPYYLGKTYGGRLFKIWEETLLEIYPTPLFSPYFEILLSAAIGCGKCLAKGTKVLMHDGTIKNVEDIKVGDKLMGDDSTPRNVLSTCIGREPMYKIVPNQGGESFVCNESHILSLKCTTGTRRKDRDNSIDNISVKDYLNKSNQYKGWYKLYRVPVEFSNNQPLDIDPYVYGCWLGDGCTVSPRITNPDKEILDYLTNSADKYNLDYHIHYDKRNNLPTVVYRAKNKTQGNILLKIIKESTKTGHKRILHRYLTASREDRLQLLAGIIDTDGYAESPNKGYRVVTTKYKDLAEDYAFLSRSLGFKTTVHERNKKLKYKNDEIYTSYDVSISGDLTLIPNKVLRKKCTESHYVVDPLKTGFKVEPQGIGDYYGFEIDGNRLFLLGDFTVTHNTSVSVIGMLYDIHKLLCLKDPQAYYGLTQNTTIAFSLFSATLSLATDVNWTSLVDALRESPYFCEKLEDSKVLDNNAKTSMIPLAKNIGLQIGSSFKHTIGKAVFGSLLDEASFQNSSSERNQAQDTYNALSSRADSRYANSVLYNPLPGHQWLASSPQTATDFLAVKINKSEGRKGILVKKDIALWHAKPHLMQGDKFYVLVGDKETQSQIVEDYDSLPENMKLKCHPVPEMFRGSFEDDIDLAIMDKLGLSITNASNLFKTNEGILKSMIYENPFKKEVIDNLSFMGNDEIMDYMNKVYFRNLRDRQYNRFIMLDAGLTNDIYGITGIYAKPISDDIIQESEYARANRTYHVDFSIGIKAIKGERINFQKIRNFIDYLTKEMQYPLVKIGADQFQSEDMLQYYKLKGYETEKVSVVIDPTIYENTRDAIENETLFLVKSVKLENELLNLRKVYKSQRASNTNKGRNYMYDHPPASEGGSKDISDSLAGAYKIANSYPTLINPARQISSYFDVAENEKTESYYENLTDEEFLKELEKSDFKA